MNFKLKLPLILITFFIGLSSAFSAQAATQIFRSVGPGATASLATDNSHAYTVTVSSGTATFSSALSNNIGVGDAVIIDTGGTDQAIDSADTLLFIHSRTSSTSYTLRTHTGATPSDIPINDTWAIYRAYTSLYNAEAGTPNTSIPITFNGGNRDLVANGEQWNIACYANDTTADTTAVTVDGWNTGTNNFIRIFTPVSATEVGTSQRHDGKWDENKYRLAGTVTGSDTGIMLIQDLHVRIDGLQMRLTDMTANSQIILGLMNQSGSPEVYVSNNIIRGVATISYLEHLGILFYYDPTGGKGYVYNNIVYDFGYNDDMSAAIMAVGDGDRYFYNNTIHNSYSGFSDWSSNSSLKNNIVQNCVFGYNGTFDSSSDYNLSDLASDGPSPSYRYGLATEVTFVDEANDDFHLAQTDPYAKDAGTNLSADANLAFSTDIDGATRTSVTAWDIGADETATRIFRSVGPSATGALATDSSHANTITLASGVATFSAALADNIGVGDAVIIDTGGTDQAIDASDTLLFIHSRTSSTSYTLRTHTGATPSDITINDTYQIYRAHTSLSLAEAGTKNTSIPITFNGGNRDLLTNNEEWNIACYANGTTSDSTDNQIGGWSTGFQNFIKIYTPVSTGEVGVSQRHAGKWDENKWYIKKTGDWGYLVVTGEDNVIFEGLQIGTSARYHSGLNINYDDSVGETGNISVTNCIFLREVAESGEYSGIAVAYENSGYHKLTVKNCVIDGFDSGFNLNVNATIQKIYIYNNTVSNASYFMYRGRYMKVVNNLMTNVGYFMDDGGPIAPVNISDVSHLVTDGTVSFDTTGFTSIYENQSIDFVNPDNHDFHLSQSDTSARGLGINLTNDIYSPFGTDIDGQLRNPAGAGWDIGADEGTVEFVSTVMQSGGNFSTLSSWEDAIDSDLVADTTRVFAHGGITGTIVGGNTVTGLTSGATATVVYATSTQILLHSVSGTFQSGETLTSSAAGTLVISDNGNPASAVAKIDGAWTAADTTEVVIDGWTSGVDNYIKIYTVNAARHKGIWDNAAYHIESALNTISVLEDNTTIDGLQVREVGTDEWRYAIRVWMSSATISSNILKNESAANNRNGISASAAVGELVKINNNIIYGFSSTGISVSTGNSSSLIYNNTIYNSNMGISSQYLNSIIKNNIISNCANAFNDHDGFADGSDYNATDGSAYWKKGSHNIVNARIDFVSTVAGSEDFHLKSTSYNVIDKGTDLSNDSYLAFSTDIDGTLRANMWDIGADETATQIYRSVGPGKTDTLDSDSGHTRSLTELKNGVATFSAAVPDNVGVGDVVIIDTNNDEAITSADTLLFIQKRNSSTSYQLQTHTGATPSDITINDTYQIYRAHTSLANAESGTINSTLSGLGFTFNGGNRDLVANNERWNIACYANGTTADTTATTIDGWNTGSLNYLKVYTPVEYSEVGVSQRHDGKWDDTKYKFESTTDTALRVSDSYTGVFGLQLKTTKSDFNPYILSFSNGGNDGIAEGNIIVANFSGSVVGSAVLNQSSDVKYINNLLYSIGSVLSTGFIADGNAVFYAYNNTVYNFATGFNIVWGGIAAKNNIAQNCTDGYNGTFEASSDYNISDLAADAPNATFTGGTADVLFIDEANDDFRLSSDDTAAKGAGLNLSTDTDLSFFDDIRGQARPASPTAWSIGASEPQSAGKIKLEGTQIKMEGDAKFE